jgi:hypothetical protein
MPDCISNELKYELLFSGKAFKLIYTNNLLVIKVGLGIKKQKGNRHIMSVSQMWRIWRKNPALEPNPFLQKGGEKVLHTSYKKKIKRMLS